MSPLLVHGLLALALKAPPGGDLYRDAVSRTLSRVQAELVASVDLEVDHASWENPWVVTTEHFEVRATSSYVRTRKIADGLEFVYAEFAKLLGPLPPSREKRRVWIFPTIGDYNRFGEQNGAEHSSMLGSFYASGHAERPVVSYDTGNLIQLGMWVTHSVVHLLLEQAFGAQPLLWVDEGLASYFALFWDWPYGASELERLEKSGSFIPLAVLLSDPMPAYVARPHDHFVELGMLVHFLLNSHEATRNVDGAPGPFQEFLRGTTRGKDVRSSEFLQLFDADEAEAEFRAFPFAFD